MSIVELKPLVADALPDFVTSATMSAINIYASHVLKRLRLIEPFDELEREHLLNTIAWIESGVEVCRIDKPVFPPKHLVAYCVLVIQDQILLVNHRSAQLWLPPGGQA